MADTRSLVLENFSGGLDLRSSLANIQNGFTPDALNFQLNEEGGIEKVRGYEAFADLGSGNTAHKLYYFETTGGTKWLIAATATNWYKIADDGTVTSIRSGMSGAANTTFVTYNDVLYGVDPSNAMHSWDGAAGSTSAVSGSPPNGRILGVWDNKLFVADTGVTIKWSGAGDFTSWTSTDTVTLSGPSSANEIIGGAVVPDGLAAFTKGGLFLLHDSTTGANQLIDHRVGLSHVNALAASNDTLYGVDSRGIYATNGRSPAVYVSDKIEPVFDSQPTLSSACGVMHGQKYLCSFGYASSSNDRTFEVYESLGGAIMANEYPMLDACVSDIEGNDNLYFIDGSGARYIRKGDTGGDFAGTAIDCYYHVRPQELRTERYQKRINRVRVLGFGDLSVGTIVGYTEGENGVFELSFPALSTDVWDTGVWDTAIYAGYALQEGEANIIQGARDRYLGFKLSESSSVTSYARSQLGASLQTKGGAGVYRMEIEFAPTRTRRSGK